MKANEIIFLHFCNKKEERIYIVIFFTVFNSHKLFDKYCVLRAVRSLQLCLTLCDPMDCSLPGSFVHGISKARILEWVAIFYSKGSSRPRDQTHVSCVSCGFFTTEFMIWSTKSTLLKSNQLSKGNIFLFFVCVCNKVLLKYKRDRESFWHRYQKGAERVPLC